MTKDNLKIPHKAIELLEKIGFSDLGIIKSHDGDDLLIYGVKYSDRANTWVGFSEKVVLFKTWSVKDLVHRVVNQWLDEEKTIAGKAMLEKIKQW